MAHLLQAGPVFARPLPAVRSAVLLRARPTTFAVRATESDNETPIKATEPTIFYGGKSFTETEVRPEDLTDSSFKSMMLSFSLSFSSDLSSCTAD